MTDRHEIEREFLLRSIDDLDAEHEAGDLDDEAYQRLRDSYTERAAALLRSEESTADVAPSAGGAEHSRGDGAGADTRASRRHRVMWVAGIIAVAALSGVLLARSVGTRAGGVGLTGSGGSERTRRAECLSMSFQQPAEGIECYRQILASAPDDAEALTYQGWAMVRSGEVDDGWKNFERVVRLHPDYPDVRVFRASVLAKRKQWRAAQDELDTLARLNPPAGVLSTLSSMGLDREIAYNLLSAPVQPCWTKAEQAASALAAQRDASTTTVAGEDGTSPSQLIAEAIICLADVAAADPTNLDALQAEGYLLGLSSQSAPALLFERAKRVLDEAVALDPRNPTSRLLRAALLNSHGDPAAAKVDLDALEGLGQPSPLYPVAPVADIRADVERSLSSPTSTVSANPTPGGD